MQRWGQGAALGAFLREQRRLADLSLRELAALTSVSNAYLSQVERGLHQPSLKVLQAIGQALGVPPASLLARAGVLDESAGADRGDGATERAIRTDPALTESEKQALLAVYDSYVCGRDTPPDALPEHDAPSPAHPLTASPPPAPPQPAHPSPRQEHP